MWHAMVKSFLSHKLRFALTTLAVVLGVTFVSGTLVFTDTMNAAFEALVDDSSAGVDVYVNPRTEFQATMDFGVGGATLPESVLSQVREVPGVRVAEGGAQGYAQYLDKSGTAITPMGPPTLGLSWTTDEGLSGVTVVRGRAPARPGEVGMDDLTAERYGFAVGDQVQILLQGPAQTFEIVGIVGFEGKATSAGATIAWFELDTAQGLFDQRGELGWIEVAGEEGVSAPDLRDDIARGVDADVEVITGEDQGTEQKDDIASAMAFFTQALLIFAAIAVFVGAFIIFNTFTITVAQRVREFGLLRALGATGRQVMFSVLGEALVIGFVASILGIGAGLGAAVGLRALMEGFGMDVPAAALELAPRTIVVAMLVGMGITLLSAVLPARRAARVPPVAAMQESVVEPKRSLARRMSAGIGLALVGALLIGLGTFASFADPLPLVGAGSLALFLGVAALSPVMARPIVGFVGAPFPRMFGITGVLARENARRSPRRTASTAAALMIGLAVVTFVSIFGASLKASMDAATGSMVTSDLVVTTTGGRSSFQSFSGHVADELSRLPDVEAVSSVRYGEWADENGSHQLIYAVEAHTIGRVWDMRLIEGSLPALGDGGVLVKTSEAEDKGVHVGDTIGMTFGNTGTQQVRVDGIYESPPGDPYLLSMTTFNENYNRRQDFQVYVVAKPGASIPDLKRSAQAVLADFPNVVVQDMREFREQNAAMVDQLMGLVYALLGLALFIAVLGITNTLALSIHERKRELGLLRAVGASRSQIRRMIRWEAGAMAIFGTMLGLAVGGVLAFVLVTPLEDMGLSQVAVPWLQVALFVVIAALAGLGAAIVPARRAARIDVLEAVAYE